MKRRFAWLTSHGFIGVVLLALIIGHYFSNEPLIEALRLKTFDSYQQIQPRTPDYNQMLAQTVIIDIDDSSLKAIGQWPWPRTVLAKLVDNLMSLGVAVVGFDAVFPEKDRTSPDMVAESIQGLSENISNELKKLGSNEQVFADAITRGRVVLGQVGVHESTDLAHLTQKVGFGTLNGDPKPYLRQYMGLVRNLPELEEAAHGLGLFSTLPDNDGVYRRVALFERVGDMIYPSLSLEMLRVALQGKDDYLIKSYPEGGIKSVVVKTADPKQGFDIPTDREGRVWVHYAKYDLAEPQYVPAKDILNVTPETREQMHALLSGKLAVVGTSAAGLKDIRPTPINGAMPGVEVHLQLLETILSNANLTRPDFARMIELGMILIGGLLMIVMVPRLNALYVFLFLVLQITVQLYIAWHYYTTERVLVDVSYPSLSIAAMFLALGYLNYMREERERQQIKGAFAHYVSPALLDQLAKNPEKLTLGGETRNITILFCDIRGFTTISEQFDAHGLTQFINSFLTPMTNVLLAHKATIDKYMGDAIMAFWNAPLDDPDHHKNACAASLAMLIAVKELNATLEAKAQVENKKHIPVNIGVGLNTGDCCVGNMGSEQRFDYSALGDDVNLASRLEGQSKTYGVSVVIGHSTYLAVKDEFATIQLDLLQVKGKTEPVFVYALLGDKAMRAGESFQRVAEHNAKMLAAYRAQKWDEALSHSQQCVALFPVLEHLHELYAERIAEYKETPPPANWNGAYIATSK